MDRPNADPVVLEGGVRLPVAPSSVTIEPLGDVMTDDPDLDELLDYQPVPPQQSHTALVRLRQGRRLKPLPYALDEEDS
jgi:hypothetical protein